MDHYVTVHGGENKIPENVCFAKVFREFGRKFFARRTKITTKYGLRTFNGWKQNLNHILIINLLLLATKRDTKTNGVAEQMFCAYDKQNRFKFQVLV